MALTQRMLFARLSNNCASDGSLQFFIEKSMLRMFLPILITAGTLIGCGEPEPKPVQTDWVDRFIEDDSPEIVATKIHRAVSEGNLYALWEWYPSKHQQMIEKAKTSFVERINSEIWNKTFDVLEKSGVVLKQKRDFIIDMPIISSLPKRDRDAIRENWDEVVDLFNQIATSEIRNYETLKKLEVKEFIATTATPLLKRLLALSERISPSFAKSMKANRAATFRVASRGESLATLICDVPGITSRVEKYVKVDGKWVRSDILDLIESRIAELELEQHDPAIAPESKDAALRILTHLEASLDRLLAAKDQEVFDEEVNRLATMLQETARQYVSTADSQ